MMQVEGYILHEIMLNKVRISGVYHTSKKANEIFYVKAFLGISADLS